MKTKRPDRILLFIVLTLVVVGFAIFISAALGQVGRDSASFTTIVIKQLAILLAGLLLMIVFSNIPYKHYRPYSLALLALAIGLNLLVFLPHFGYGWNGARRWLSLGNFSFQPSEFLKLAFIIFLAAWMATQKEKIKGIYSGLLPFIIFLGVVAAILLKQPDTGTLMVIVASALGIFILAGGRWSHLFLIFLLGVVMLGVLFFTRPYVRERIETFINPKQDSLGSSYQINQSLIAIGSGGIFGRGFGQSIQKFNFLPEPIGDSIFAVAGEEWGLIGTVFLLALYLIFSLWGLKIISRVRDPFGYLLGGGLIIMITGQSLINIGAMLGLLPLTGVPLVFVSHGGSALLLALISVGIILNISRSNSKA